MRSESALLDDSDERLGAVPPKNTWNAPGKSMLANRGFSAEATTTTTLHSDPPVMPGIAPAITRYTLQMQRGTMLHSVPRVLADQRCDDVFDIRPGRYPGLDGLPEVFLGIHTR